MVTKYKNLIDGNWIESCSGEYIENQNPADITDIIGLYPVSNEEDVAFAASAAKEAFKKWRLIPAPKRGDVLKLTGDIMSERKDEIAIEMTREMGKVFAETRGDVQEGIDTAYYAASEGRRLFGFNAPSELRDKMNMSFRIPVGAAGIITPWNFPMAIPTWKIFPALVSGNTVVFKPAELTPKTAHTLVEILDEAMRKVLGKDYIPGVLNLVHGKGSITGEAIINNPDIDLISFTGSTVVGKHINETAGKKLKRVSLELGGKNALIFMDDGDMELALEAIIWGAFGTTGQRCTATSRLIIQKDVHDEFLKRLVKNTEKLKLGYGNNPETNIGPCVSKEQREKVDYYVQLGVSEENAKLETGGTIADEGDLNNGWFYKPTILSNVETWMRVAKEEIFGPVLCVIKADSLENAIEIANDTKYGLSSSIFTKDINSAFRAIRDLQAGITYINSATIGAEAHMPFGGVKETGNGHREGGWTVFDFFTEWKTVYVDYSGKLQRAQIDNY